jgi:hypothetical protein
MYTSGHEWLTRYVFPYNYTLHTYQCWSFLFWITVSYIGNTTTVGDRAGGIAGLFIKILKLVYLSKKYYP